MNETLKLAIISAVISAVIASLFLFVSYWLVGNPADNLGAAGITRFPNSGMAVRYITATSTPNKVTSGTDGYLQVLGITGDTNVNVTITSSTFTGSISAQSSTTIKCPIIYASSSVATTYYVYVDTTTSTRGAAGVYLVAATTTKPSSICP